MLLPIHSGTHWNAGFSHHHRKQYSLLIALSEVLFKGHMPCLSHSVTTVVSVGDSGPDWVFLPRACLAPHICRRGTLGQSCSSDGRSSTQGRCTAQPPGFCTRFPEMGNRGLWGYAIHQFILKMPSRWVFLPMNGSEGKSPVVCISKQNT